MTGDSHTDDESTHAPGEIVADTLRALADADDPETVATVAADGAARLLSDPADCVVYDAAGDPLVAGASDGSDPPARRGSVGVVDPPPETLSWPADPLVVPVGDTGWLALWADSGETAPMWAIRTLANATVDAARTRDRIATSADRIATLETETEQLNNFATIVAHDLRNPLAIARSNLQLARENGDDEHFATIDDAHERIQQIIDRTLSVARDEGGFETERVAIGEVAQTAWETVETGAATLTVSHSLRLAADRDRLRQLFENLFRNAVEHGATRPAPHARRDTVEHGATADAPETADDSAPPLGHGLAVEVGTLPEEAGFFVADNGPGIPEGDRESVFEQGYSERGGTGFGLMIVREVADEHGWSVTVTDSDWTASRDTTGTDDATAGARFEFVVTE